MKLLVTLSLIFILHFACGRKNVPPQPPRPPVPTPTATPLPSPIATPSPTPISPPCEKAGDISPELVVPAGTELIYDKGGCVRSRVVVEGRLRLIGTYQVTNEPILVKSGGSIIGTWDTVLVESTTQWTVISAYESYLLNGASDSNITLKGFRVVGANPNFNSTPQAIALGNCVNCTVDGLWIDRTRSIGIQLGGGGMRGHYAKDSKIVNCLLTAVASQAIALVNGEGNEISNNRILRPGQAGGPGASSIDLEVNASDDRLTNNRITVNYIDHRGSELPTSGNGIIINSGDTENVSGNLIADNVIIGGDLEPATNYLSNAIMVFGAHMKGTVVVRNKITRTGQTGATLQGSDITFEDNELVSVGGGGIVGFQADVTNSRIRRNSLRCMGGPCESTMMINGAGNVTDGNVGWEVKP